MTEQQDIPGGRWFCEICQRRYPDPGDCSHCPEEPLLDLHDEDTRLIIEEMDSRRRRKRHTLLGLLSLAACSPIFFLGMFISRKLAALGWFFATGGLTAVLWKKFPTQDRLPKGEGFEDFGG